MTPFLDPLDVLGFILIGVAIWAFLFIPERADWPVLAVMAVGGLLIDRARFGSALKSLLPFWRK